MKIYRIVPNGFGTNGRLDESHGFENIYYHMGYIPFVDRSRRGQFNNLSGRIHSEGKYFFLFFEDALQASHGLINTFHNLCVDNCYILEYDIPIEIILKNIGYGDYSKGIISNFLAECYIEKDDFGSKVINAGDLSISAKGEAVLLLFNEFLKELIKYNRFSYGDVRFYTRLFQTDDLESVIQDQERIREVLLNSPFYRYFMDKVGDLVESSFITGKRIPINLDLLSRFNDLEPLCELYRQMGVKADFSDEQFQFKKELLKCLFYDNPNNDKITQLLQERKYI